MLAELRLARDVLPAVTPPVSTVFFGGGTPSLLPAEHLGLIVRAIGEEFGLAPDAEVTTEANPESVTPAYLGKLRDAGFTRISLGMQSAAEHVLAVLDRQHRPQRALEAVAEARAAGFEHVNLDLIYGTPGESDRDWQTSLDAAIGSGADHLSAYALIVEEGTPLARKVASGAIGAPEDDVLADRYLQADEALAAAGFGWYEVSNWARTPAARSAHNQLYWSGANWWGAGPGAHSHVGGIRWWNVKHPARYAGLLETGRSPAAGRETLDPSGPAHRADHAAAADVRGAGAGRPAGRRAPARRAVRRLGVGRTAAAGRRPAGAHPARPAAGRRGGAGSAAGGRLSLPA